MSANFERAMKFVSRWEGGFVDHPDDPGGRTNMGVTQKTYDAYRDERKLPRQDVKELARAEADSVYAENYWSPAKCDTLRWPLCLVQFDTAVNLGVARANRMLEESGRDTDHYLFTRRNYYVGLANHRPKLAVFLRGWLNRLDSLEGEVRKAA